MLYIVLSSLILLAFLDRVVRGGRVKLIKIDLEFDLFALRDELRNAAFVSKISYDNWFDYMDTTITRTIERIDNVNPWLAVGYGWAHRNDPSLFHAQRALETALRLPENQRLAQIHNEYVRLIGRFLEARYPISLPIAAISCALILKDSTESGIHSSAEGGKQDLAPIFSIAPETSTLSEYGLDGRRRPQDIHISEPQFVTQ